ncbi:TPA: GNAT family N-acetyltransferase [Enterococcus faecium]
MKEFMGINVTDDITLVYPELIMATEIFQLIDSDREHLDQFLGFNDFVKSVSDEVDYIKMKRSNHDRAFFIVKDEKIIGTVDLHNMDEETGKAEIGYWLHSSYTGQHIMTKSVATLIDYSFNIIGLNKLTIRADVNNLASNKVAQNLNFTFLGTKPQERKLHGTLHDMNEYYLLKQSYENNQQKEGEVF